MVKPLTLSLIIFPFVASCMTVQDTERRQPKDRIIEVPASAEQGFGCLADTVQYALGQVATAELGGKLVKESGAKTLRWIPPRTAVTTDYRQDRLNIGYDDDLLITHVGCG